MSWIMEHRGEFAGIGASACWVITSLAFAAAGRRIGASLVNMIRLVLAAAILMAVHQMRFGELVPQLDASSLWLLVISGIVGLAIGDQLLFTALVDIGPRLSTLLMTAAPIVTAVIAWPVLDEPLGFVAMGGMAITIGGICWVVLERSEPSESDVRTRHPTRRQHHVRGVVFATVAAACQGIGLILAKVGIGHTRLDAAAHIDTWSVTTVRMIAGMLAMSVIFVGMRMFRGKRGADELMEISSEQERLELQDLARLDGDDPEKQDGVGGQDTQRQAGRWGPALSLTLVGAVFGPVVGVWLSIVAVDNTAAGIAATLTSLSPVLILPLAVLIEHERPTWRACIGALIALLGVAMLSITPDADDQPAQGDTVENLAGALRDSSKP